MSGIAFQKLQGDKTAAGKQLNELITINEALDELIELKKNERPEIYKLARLYYPELELTPVMFTRTWDNVAMKNNIVDALDGKYFGVWQINVFMLHVSNSTQTRNISQLRLYNGSEVKLNLAFGHLGNRSQEMSNMARDYTGIADTVALLGLVGKEQKANISIDFYGFRVGDYEGGAELPEIEEVYTSFIDGTGIVPFTGSYPHSVHLGDESIPMDGFAPHIAKWTTETGSSHTVKIRNELGKDVNLHIGSEVVLFNDGETFERTFLDRFEIYLKEKDPEEPRRLVLHNTPVPSGNEEYRVTHGSDVTQGRFIKKTLLVNEGEEVLIELINSTDLPYYVYEEEAVPPFEKEGLLIEGVPLVVKFKELNNSGHSYSGTTICLRVPMW